MSDYLKRVPDLPRAVPTVKAGRTVTGSEVIDCRIVVRPGQTDRSGDLSTVELTSDGVWEVGVPGTPAPLTDFLDPGEDARLLDDGWRRAGTVLVHRLTALVEVHPVRAKRHLVQIRVPASTTRRNLRNLAQGLVSAGRPPVISRKDAGPTVRNIRIDLSDVDGAVAEAAGREITLGVALGEATALARDLDSLPDGTVTAEWWRREAKGLLGSFPGTRVRVRGTGWLDRKGFGGLLTVCGDPDGDAALVEAVWDPAAAEGELTDDRPDAVVVGGAQVPAVIRALARLRSPQKVVGLIPVTGGLRVPRRPLPGRPVDVVEHAGGLTTELDVPADDVAGIQVAARLAVADALAYGAQRHGPRYIISVGPTSSATRTALGGRTGGLFTADRVLARRLTLRGAKVGERWWPLPLPSRLETAVDGHSADLTAHPAGPDALTSALFLRRFAGDVPHIHLDTTGPARSEGVGGAPEAGATGFAARTLVEWLRK